MSRLPVIVGFGGINSAGRSSGFVAFRRLVLDALDQKKATDTSLSLASLMGLIRYNNGQWETPQGVSISPEAVHQQLGPELQKGTLLRRIEPSHFDGNNVPYNKKINVPTGTSFELSESELPNQRPTEWEITPIGEGKVRVTTTGSWSILQPDTRTSPVQTAGQLPSGFDLPSQ